MVALDTGAVSCTPIQEPYDVCQEGRELELEVELTTRLIRAASECDIGHLTQEQIDKLLDVIPSADQR